MDSECCSKCRKVLSAEERLVHAIFQPADGLPKCYECNMEDFTAKCSICGTSTQLMYNSTPLCPKHMERYNIIGGLK